MFSVMREERFVQIEIFHLLILFSLWAKIEVVKDGTKEVLKGLKGFVRKSVY